MAGPKLSRSSERRPIARPAPRKVKSRWERWNEIFWSYVPLKAETIERVLTLLTGTAIVSTLLAIAVYAGIPQFVGTEIGQVTGRAGFHVKRVEVKGLDRMDNLTVYAVALDQKSIAMPLVDIDKVRGQLLQYGWIEDARISRRWPDTLVVDIVERKPRAIWQNNQQLVLIDGTGVILEMVDPRAIPDLPIVIGPNANQQVERLYTLLDSVPALKRSFAGASGSAIAAGIFALKQAKRCPCLKERILRQMRSSALPRLTGQSGCWAEIFCVLTCAIQPNSSFG